MNQEVKHTPERVINAIDREISKCRESLWIDVIRLNKGWSPCIVNEIVELENARNLLLKSEAIPCCGNINNEGCACRQYLERNNLITKATK